VERAEVEAAAPRATTEVERAVIAARPFQRELLPIAVVAIKMSALRRVYTIESENISSA
jgi:hypothetical protein